MSKKLVKIDKTKYSKECAFKNFSWLAKFLYYSGAVTMYLDYQLWKPHFRWWHPITWIVVLAFGVIGFFSSICETFDDLTKNKNKKYYNLKDAPKYISSFNSFVAEPLSEYQKEKADKGEMFYAKKVSHRFSDLTVTIGDKFIDSADIGKSVLCIVHNIYIENGDAFVSSGPDDRGISFKSIATL